MDGFPSLSHGAFPGSRLQLHYILHHCPLQGTRSSKKKKERKLNRVMGTVKKATRKGQESHSESFAALHLLHDPQVIIVLGEGVKG